MIKTHKIPNKVISDFDFGFRSWLLRFVSDFEIRISDLCSTGKIEKKFASGENFVVMNDY